jgi:hypothetical protein
VVFRVVLLLLALKRLPDVQLSFVLNALESLCQLVNPAPLSEHFHKNYKASFGNKKFKVSIEEDEQPSINEDSEVSTDSNSFIMTILNTYDSEQTMVEDSTSPAWKNEAKIMHSHLSLEELDRWDLNKQFEIAAEFTCAELRLSGQDPAIPGVVRFSNKRLRSYIARTMMEIVKLPLRAKPLSADLTAENARVRGFCIVGPTNSGSSG